jgi:hypothetical protein
VREKGAFPRPLFGGRVAIARNYLSGFEPAQMQRIVQDRLFESDFDRMVRQLELKDSSNDGQE